MPQKYRYLGMCFFLLFSLFMCWFSYHYIYIGFLDDISHKLEIIEVSLGSGITTYSSILFLAYSIAFLFYNFRRRSEPIELWATLSSNLTTIVIIGLLAVSIPCGYIYKEYKKSVLIDNGYSFEKVRERRGLFKLDYDVYTLKNQ